MKLLGIFSLVLCPLFAQDAGSSVVLFGGGSTLTKYGTGTYGNVFLLSNITYFWEITKAASGAKTFTFNAGICIYTVYVGAPGLGFYLPVFPGPLCTPFPQAVAQNLAPIQTALAEFNGLAPDYAHYINYGPFARPVHPQLTLAQPSTPVDPQMILYDGISNNIVDLDLTTNAILSQVTIPISTFVSVFGVLPSATSTDNVVWAASPQQGIFIVDTGAGTLTANIPTPSLNPSNIVPAGIVFTNSGATALYAVSYSAADAAGNNGALLVFDVASRTLKSTLLLKYAPTALVMAPDGLTAYLLSNTGMITYYDVFSGTADLSASTYTAGMQGGYPGSSTRVFIHPDGTRLFWNVGTFVAVFDLTVRQVTGFFNSSLAAGSGASMQMSQDGSTVWFASAAGDVVIVDTRFGNVLGTYQTSPQSVVYPGPGN